MAIHLTTSLACIAALLVCMPMIGALTLQVKRDL
jgi:hypothetical protein